MEIDDALALYEENFPEDDLPRAIPMLRHALNG